MPAFVGLVRGINVGGRGKVPMAELTKLVVDSGMTDVRTYLQSGNVVFDAPDDARPARLSADLVRAFEERFGFKAGILVLRGDALARIAAANPFAARATGDPPPVHVMFLMGEPQAPAVSHAELAGRLGDVGDDEFALGEGAVYLFCPQGVARTRLSGPFFERTLGVPVTMRNWRTVMQLVAVAGGRDV